MAAGKSDRFDASCWASWPAPTISASPRSAPSATKPSRCAARQNTRGSGRHAGASRQQLRAAARRVLARSRRIFADVEHRSDWRSSRATRSRRHHRAGPKRLEGFLARHAYSGRRSVDELLDPPAQRTDRRAGRPASRGAPQRDLGPGRALTAIVDADHPADQPDRRRRRDASRRTDLPVVFKDSKSVVTAAGLLAEIGDDRARYQTADGLAAEAGQAPVAKERANAATPRSLGLRQAPARPLRHAADSTRHWHPWATTLRPRPSRGCDTPTPPASWAAPGAHHVALLARPASVLTTPPTTSATLTELREAKRG